jgi:hypothetical protein
MHEGQVAAALSDSALWLGLWLLTVVLVLPLVGVVRSKNE